MVGNLGFEFGAFKAGFLMVSIAGLQGASSLKLAQEPLQPGQIRREGAFKAQGFSCHGVYETQHLSVQGLAGQPHFGHRRFDGG